ncbi:MAG: nicotinate phosphoribosyltransferase [Capsulimonadaceae bacterium]|nr:nicotinate phosphoribosyltransferase [Capsulimonadaceae bacterium]
MIIKTLLDTDLYKLTMQQAVLHRFPEALAEYRFASRSQNVDIRPFVEEIRDEIDALCSLTFTRDEIDFLASLPYFAPGYLASLAGFRLSPDAVTIEADPAFRLTVRGNWQQTILFEVPLLAIINEVYCRNTYPMSKMRRQEGERRLLDKCHVIRQSDIPLRISEFGTRRRYSRDWQSHVVETLARETGSSLAGTSNLADARRLNLTPVGTMGHEFLQAFQVLAPLALSQKIALQTWQDEFRGDLGIALSDVIGIDAFLADFDGHLAKAYDGARHDSGDPVAWGERLVAHYESLGIDPTSKTAVFTDSLTIADAQRIARHFAGRIRATFGIGTHLTNDFDFDAPQIVIKMVRCNDWPVAKLSDSPGKTLCDDALYLALLRKLFARSAARQRPD